MLAPAKLNLCLHVGPKRPDGYHDLFSLVAFANIGDELTVAAADTTELIIEGPFASELSNVDQRDNIVWAAAGRILDLSRGTDGSPLGLRLNLIKRLPVASGIGGGSADAAAALRLAADCVGLNITADELAEIGLALGADVPVCLFAQTAWMSGIGESLSPGPQLPDTYVVLANPGKAVPTKEVFDRYDMQPIPAGPLAPANLPAKFASFDDLIGFLQTVRNDLERPATQFLPEIGNVLGGLVDCGAELARMSGSGATCFGLFSSKTAAEACRDQMRLRHSQWWIDAGVLIRE